LILDINNTEFLFNLAHSASTDFLARGRERHFSEVSNAASWELQSCLKLSWYFGAVGWQSRAETPQTKNPFENPGWKTRDFGPGPGKKVFRHFSEIPLFRAREHDQTVNVNTTNKSKKKIRKGIKGNCWRKITKKKRA